MGSCWGETCFILGGLGAAVPARLDTWLTEDTHRVRYGALFAPEEARVTGNVLARPAELPPDGKMHRAEIGPIWRDRNRDVQQIVRGVAVPLADKRLFGLGYDIDSLDQIEDTILRALVLGLAPAVLLALSVGLLLARRGQRRIAAVHFTGWIGAGRSRATGWG
jgi:hypothetical protein